MSCLSHTKPLVPCFRQHDMSSTHDVIMLSKTAISNLQTVLGQRSGLRAEPKFDIKRWWRSKTQQWECTDTSYQAQLAIWIRSVGKDTVTEELPALTPWETGEGMEEIKEGGMNKIRWWEAKMLFSNSYHFTTLSAYAQYADELKLLSEQFSNRFIDFKKLGDCFNLFATATKKRYPDHRVFVNVHRSLTEGGHVPNLIRAGGRPCSSYEEEVLQEVADDPSISNVIVGTLHSFKSVDCVTNEDEATNYPTDFLNSLDVPDLPPHNLQLKVGSVVIMLRNLNQPKLCNGTQGKFKEPVYRALQYTLEENSLPYSTVTLWCAELKRGRKSTKDDSRSDCLRGAADKSAAQAESSNLSNIEHRAVIKYFVKKGKTPKEIFEDMVSVLQESTPSYTMVKKWARLFQQGRESCEDNPRPGRPVTVVTEENVRKIEKLVLADQRIKLWKIAEELQISKE
ncbi:Putative uncharacterized protein FLJ37770 [Eumeta japonica]|uniref:Uncharacterized protein n=1 Tax=Eumeta variegata TaxID=151549 RepID=A0A4C1TU57_EUMVA|nr:Putative uncharacterized protein FLJ37770 [Eumeta japonica]